MTRFWLFLMCFIFVLSIPVIKLNAQAVQDQPAQSQSEEKKADSAKSGKEKTAPFTIGEVVVKQKRIANIENATTTTIVTSEDIEAHANKDLSDVLQTVPGMRVVTANKHTRYIMRGFDQSYVALLLDGIPVIDVYESNVDIRTTPVMNLSEIIINRGVCSALYGTAGTVGSINMVSKKPVTAYGKVQAEYGAKGDYSFNAALGDVTGGFYYLFSATAQKQAPYEVSKKLDRSERLKWFNEFCPSDAGYSKVDTTSDVPSRYLNGENNWPHTEMFKNVISGKAGYQVSDNLEVGITSNYVRWQDKRYTLTYNTDSYGWNSTNKQYQWSASDPTMTLTSSAFNWQQVWSVNASPYANYKNGNFEVKTNAYYYYTYEFLDGYTNASETSVNSSWGGAHSNWNNSSAGFNVFPSYKLFAWNKINTSVMFRHDRHVEKEQADSEFKGTGEGLKAYNYSGYDWFVTKIVAGSQLTVALEDEMSLSKLISSVPVDISAGVSYDAQSFDENKQRGTTGSSYNPYLTDAYKLKKDSMIWGTRDSFNPVIGLTYEPVKDFLLLRASYDQKMKLPTMSMYASVTSNSQDDGLKPEKSYNSNAGFELFFLQKAASLRADYFYSRFKDKLATIYDSTRPNFKYYTNIKGEEHKGVEVISDNKFKGISGMMDFDLNLGYTYTLVTNLDRRADSNIYKGKRVADVPEHQVTADLRMNFITRTALDIFGDYQANAIKYAMASNPSGTTYTTSCFKEVKLHNPLMLNVKISQKIYEKYEVYVLCKNILDDYDADPFNPGPGRQFFAGLSAEL